MKIYVIGEYHGPHTASSVFLILIREGYLADSACCMSFSRKERVEFKRPGP